MMKTVILAATLIAAASARADEVNPDTLLTVEPSTSADTRVEWRFVASPTDDTFVELGDGGCIVGPLRVVGQRRVVVFSLARGQSLPRDCDKRPTK